MSHKDALSCWVNTCPPHSIWWEEEKLGFGSIYKGKCKSCEIGYSIGGTIGDGMVTSNTDYAKIQELNK